MTPLAQPLATALALLVILAAVTDVAARRIPNALVVAGAVAGLLLHVRLNGWIGVKTSVLGLAVGLLILMPLFLLRATSGGDVKLLAAIGAIAGPINTLVIFILAGVSGGVLSLVLLVWKGGLTQAFYNCVFIVSELLQFRAPHERRPELSVDHPRSTRLPYAVPIAVGALLFLAI